MNINLKIILVFITSMILSYIFIKRYIIKAKNKNVLYLQREELINKETKSKTPQGGGKYFILSSLLSLLIIDYKVLIDKNVLLILIPSIIFFVLGLIDDIKKRKTYKGLSPLLRAIVEIIVSFIFLYYSPLNNSFVFHLPNNNYIYLGSIFIILIPLIVFGSTNAINLSDGMDGLLSFLFSLSILPILLKSLYLENYNIALLLISLYGSLFSFLRFNIHPASVFMGDEGSLFLGGIFAFSSLLLNLEYLMPISGFIFVVETVSVILQVIYFNIRKKRIFLMSPLHHHFEMKGVKEWKIVFMFILIQMVCLIISISLI